MLSKTDFANSNSYLILKIVSYSVIILFLIKSIHLQVIEKDKYQRISSNQSNKQLRIEPLRGNIFDRNGKLIVHSQPSFSVSITPKEFNSKSMILLAEILKVDTFYIKNQLKKYNNYSLLQPIKVFKDVDNATIANIEEYNDMLDGVSIEVESKRKYENEIYLTHLLGYTGEISQKQIDSKKFYRPGDQIGRTGLEEHYEDFLKGVMGIQWIVVNKNGKKISSFDNGNLDLNPVKGIDLYLNIDFEMQKKAEELLKDKIGAVVAMDTRTGGVLVFASNPNYNLEDFSGKILRNVYEGLRSNPKIPLLNRVYQAYQPGSSWKMLIGLAALNEGLIDVNTTFYCSGSLFYGGRAFHCTHSDGNVALINAIRSSCNVYFYNLGIKLGVEKIQEYGEMFGFGKHTNIDLPDEKRGNFPTYEQLSKKYGGHVPKGLALNWAIGQGEILTTPLQMCAYTVALANKGRYMEPRVVKKIYNHQYDREEVISTKSRQIELPDQYYQYIKEGMYRVVNEPGGTAGIARLPEVIVSGKTSTAQNPHGKPHAWFVSFAPYDTPEIAIVVMIENGGYGGAAAAPISKELMKCYFKLDSASLNKIIAVN